MKRTKKSRILLLFWLLLILLAVSLVFYWVRKTKVDKVNNTEEKTLTEEEKRAKREINDIEKESLPKEMKNEEGKSNLYVQTPKKENLRKIRCVFPRKDEKELLQEEKSPLIIWEEDNFELWKKTMKENCSEVFFARFPKSLNEFWENYYKLNKRISKISRAASLFRKKDNEEEVDWIYERRRKERMMKIFRDERLLASVKKFIEEKINPELKDHLDQFEFYGNDEKIDQWMKKYASIIGYGAWLGNQKWSGAMQNLGKNAQCKYKRRILGNFTNKETKNPEFLELISSFVLVE